MKIKPLVPELKSPKKGGLGTSDTKWGNVPFL